MVGAAGPNPQDRSRGILSLASTNSAMLLDMFEVTGYYFYLGGRELAAKLQVIAWMVAVVFYHQAKEQVVLLLLPGVCRCLKPEFFINSK